MSLPTKDWACYARTGPGGFRTQHDTLGEAREAASGWQADYANGRATNIVSVFIERRNHAAGEWERYETVPLVSQP